MKINKNIEVFFALLRAGLWEKEIFLSQYGAYDLEVIRQISEEQSVAGLITAGIDHIVDNKVPQEELLQFVGTVLQLEQQNVAMNDTVAKVADFLQDKGVYALLVKGQGVARCYARPQWRVTGDIDLLLDEENYYKSIDYLNSIASTSELQDVRNLGYGMTIDSCIVELHGTLRCGLSRAMDHEIDAIQRDTFENKRVRSWKNKGVEVLIPAPNNDAFFIFTHIIKHFYKGGIGLRQICDLSQLLWRYRDEMDSDLILERLRRLKLYDEWRAFAAFIVEYLGHPKDAMPLYDSNPKWSKKARHIYKFVMDVGNFGHNRDLSYYGKYNLIVRKAISFWWRLRDIMVHATAFPYSSIRFFPTMLVEGMRATAINAFKNSNE